VSHEAARLALLRLVDQADHVTFTTFAEMYAAADEVPGDNDPYWLDSAVSTGAPQPGRGSLRDGRLRRRATSASRLAQGLAVDPTPGIRATFEIHFATKSFVASKLRFPHVSEKSVLYRATILPTQRSELRF